MHTYWIRKDIFSLFFPSLWCSSSLVSFKCKFTIIQMIFLYQTCQVYIYMKVLMKHLSLARMHTLRSSIITQHNFRLIVPNTTWKCVHSYLWRQWIKVIWSLNNITLWKERKKKKKRKNEHETDKQLLFSFSLFYSIWIYRWTFTHTCASPQG